ncbi:GNAT family N-acetyltransferase [Sphingomonas koreensis]|uniref:GNAT family N-acetyltransferase n=1 Tax=Sphingomonas koreensis TaxID=93064 RepID=UPI000830CAFF|nr:GNAT family N-acetyltransferase [Sphingomonas koreensis]PJI88141.1 streptothricin acetyltransferase [Sphingomonas koreensis]RSU59408.1 GNAT family N-acetyltransferase [Sphingomonas koreensis]RSU66699.1 GNAT family N-acetyltransferase [Sphingomonas koreensis]
MSAGVGIERIATIDPAMLAQCDFSFDPAVGAYPFDSALAVPRSGRMIAVARTDGRVAGYLACLSDGASAEMRRIEIDRGYRGQGLGRRLLDEARNWAWATGLSALWLETLADNPAAGRFFGRYGFTLTVRGDVLHWRMPLPG